MRTSTTMLKRDIRLRYCFVLWVGVAGGCQRSTSETPEEITAAAPANSVPEAAADPTPNIPAEIVRRTPTTPLPPTDASLELAYERLTNGADHTPYLRALRDKFPEVEVTSPEGPPKWTTVTLNEQGARIDAVRFTSSLDGPADMRWCYIHPPNRIRQWFIAPMKGEIPGFETFWGESDIDTENLDEPADNHTVYQSLDRGQISPGEEYLLWFTFPDDKPVKIHVAVKLLPATGRPRFAYGAEAIAKSLGLQIPLRRHTPDSPEAFLQRAVQLTNVDVQTAVELAESGLKLEPDHRGLLVVASVLNRKYAAARSAVDRDVAASLYEKAAEQARTLAAKYENLSFLERQTVVHGLLELARVHAQRQEADATIELVSEALDEGFTAISDLESAEDFAFLQDNPQYTSLLDRWRDRVIPPDKIDYELLSHPADAVEFNGHWYKFYQGMLPWHLAQLRCQEEGGYLACVETEAEADFLTETLPKGDYWLGGVLEDDRWRWINGQRLVFSNWVGGEDLATATETRLMVGPDGLWSGAAPVNDRNEGYVCEWEK